MWLIWRLLAALVVLGALGFFLFAPAIAERGQNPVADHAPWPVSPAAAKTVETAAVTGCPPAASATVGNATNVSTMAGSTTVSSVTLIAIPPAQ